MFFQLDKIKKLYLLDGSDFEKHFRGKINPFSIKLNP